MHLPLIDIPKPKRSARPRCLSASLLLGACLAVSWLLPQRPEPLPECSCSLPIAPKAAPVKPVKYVTVWIKEDSNGWCGTQSMLTVQMPLLELSDELCKGKAEAEKQLGATSAKPYAFRYVEREFAAKYGLTIKQVEEIKREGSRLKELH